MASIVIVDKNGTLDDVVLELVKYRPTPKVFRADNVGEAQQLILQQTPSAVLIDDKVAEGIGVCSFVKSNPTLNQIHTIYFVSYEEDVDSKNASVNQWYVKGLYLPEEVVGSIEHIL